MLVIACTFRMDLYSIDFKGAYLHAKRPQHLPVYLKDIPGLKVPNGNTQCMNCRKLYKENHEAPHTKKGECREFWFSWKKNQKCTDCGLEDPRVIEAV